MSDRQPGIDTSRYAWDEVWLKEDWWSVWLGLGFVVLTCICFTKGITLDWIAVTPTRWVTSAELLSQMQGNAERYLAQCAAMTGLFGIASVAMGYCPTVFVPAFILLYILSLMIQAASAWDGSLRYNVEAPLIALVVGLLISNVIGLPRVLDTAFRVEFYIKTGIVLLGATLPITLLVWAGPIAILQASIASIVTFFVIFKVARFLELDKRLAAMLAAGGAVCGVSAVIAVAGAVRARREDMPVAITLVVFWAIVMIVVLPLLARAWFLHAGVAGAWIGTSEFADAAGFAAAQSYGAFARAGAVAGTPEQAIWAFTLVKVVGRDIWIGIWAFALSLIAVTRWEAAETGTTIDIAEIWGRFPKFIVGFFLASLLMTLALRDVSFADYNQAVRPTLIAPINTFRGWAFTFSFLSIGLTTRLKEFGGVSGNAFLAFSTGVVVNLVLGFVLSAVVFADYWMALSP